MVRTWCALVALAGAACSSQSQLLLVVDTDLEPGVEVSAIEVAVGGEGIGSDRRTFPLDTTELPFSLGIRPAQRDDEPVLVAATALSPEGAPVVDFQIRTRFVPGEVRVLEIPLARACALEPPCHDEGLTCLRGACVAIETDPATLPLRRGDEPRPLFEGPRVAPDAGGSDAGAACVAGEPCETGDPCHVGARACDPPRCETIETLAPGAPCGEGRVCDAEGRCGSQL
ncbi:MAG: hypothetical protein M5U28_56265 [Sandaracinaceae bacterium]|nr:hypothetical protein [Sandaracinaceae bacterium]